MVWGPNVGITYPFTGEAGLPARGTPNFRAMDTNNDSRIDVGDDPYLPYYPGDEHVDWVALSLYWYPTGSDRNNQVYDEYFQSFIVGRGPAIDRVQPQAALDGGLRDFYERFSRSRNKPLMIPETGSPYFPNLPLVPGNTELSIKQAWWRQIYDPATFARFPLLKLVTHFEEIKRDEGEDLRDWRVLAEPNTKAAFLNHLNTPAINRTLLYAQQLSFQCGGQVTVIG